MRKLVTRLTTMMLFGLIAGLVLAQTPKPASPPTIPDALKARFFKAQAQKAQIDAVVQQKMQALAQVAEAINKACGDAFVPQIDSAGDPVCVAKPVSAKEKK